MAETTSTSKQSRRKTVIGRVVSTKMAKTIVVEVQREKSHPLYRRVIRRSKKYHAHDEQQTARTGDFVMIEETRPLSALKRWRLKEVLQRAKLAEDVKEAPAAEQAE